MKQWQALILILAFSAGTAFANDAVEDSAE